MSSPRRRESYRRAVGLVTGVATAGALAATGAVTGTASTAYDDEQARRDVEAATAARKAQQQYAAQLARWQAQHPPAPRVIVKKRPARTVLRVRYVQVPASGSQPGPGGTVSSGSGGTGWSGSGSTSTGGTSHQSSGSGQYSAPPPPPPPPAPSTGS